MSEAAFRPCATAKIAGSKTRRNVEIDYKILARTRASTGRLRLIDGSITDRHVLSSVERRYGGLRPSEVRKLNHFCKKNGRLMRLVSNLCLDKKVPQVVLRKSI